MKREAIEDCDQYITSYTFTDTEYENDPVHIRINAAAGSPEGQLVRCNYLYAIKTLAFSLIVQARLYGGIFTESYRSQLLYIGEIDNKNDAPSLAQSSNSSADPSEAIAGERRALSTQPVDRKISTPSLLAIPGSNDVEYWIDFDYRGNRFAKISLFSAILEFIMTLAQLDSGDEIANISQASPTESLIIYVMPSPESSVPLQVFQVLAILESIARQAVNDARYQEMTFEFFIDNELAATGCVRVPSGPRAWCQGWREGDQQSLAGNLTSSGSEVIQI